MSTEYIVEAVHQEGMRFLSRVGQHSVTMDYPLKIDDPGAGPRPMEMLLASLASCAGGTVAALLRRAGQSVEALKVTARGARRTEHPTVFTEIALEFIVQGHVDPAVVSQALEQAETRVCPVWAMLRPSTPIRSSFRIEGA